MSDQHQREVAIFEAALQLPPEQREVYLQQACAGDAGLLQRIRALLKAEESQSDFLASAASAAWSEQTLLLAPTEKPGDSIGPYKLLQQIGEGGCGVVYMAEQEKPIRRRVALKIIKLGMDTRQVVARFEAERQALALMDHPNIAKVHDAGATTAGRPYFVMELVRGVKITDYCDEKKLSTQERLSLFIQVCQAVQHAHQKGIIHRDLKPSNILVTVNDGVAVPKVIDFGIAKATTGERLTDKTVFTAFEQFVGTPAYMSPEQAEITSVDIDTCSDIYSLGVLLYELLTGQTPFDANELLQSGLDEMRRTLREKEPARPSTRLRTLGAEELTTAAHRRGLEPPKLVNLVRGDLDWIVMKCLEKDRARRYETANGLAMDLQRHLNNEPVVARPPSNLYRFQKLVRRNKLTFAAVAAIAASLLVSLGASTWQFIQKSKAVREQTRLREAAQRAEAEQSRLRQQAQTEAEKSRQIAQLFENMLQGVGPSVAQGRDATLLREILDKTAEQVTKELTNQPAVEVEMRRILARTYQDLGLYKQMEEQLRASLAIARSQVAPQQSPAVAESLAELGLALAWQGRFPEAEVAAEEALAHWGKLEGDGSERVAASFDALAIVLYREGKLARAETLERQAVSACRKLACEDSELLALLLDNLAAILDDAGKLAEAESYAREGLAIRSRHTNDLVHIAVSVDNLGCILRDEGKFADAEALNRRALTLRRTVYPPAHPLSLESLNNLASALELQGKLEEAETLYRDYLQTLHAGLPSDDLALGQVLSKMTYVRLMRSRPLEAESSARACLAIYDNKLPDDWRTFNARSLLGGSLLAQNRCPEAERFLLSGYQGMKQREDHIPAEEKLCIKEALERLVELYVATDRQDQASEWKGKLAELESAGPGKPVAVAHP